MKKDAKPNRYFRSDHVFLNNKDAEQMLSRWHDKTKKMKKTRLLKEKCVFKGCREKKNEITLNSLQYFGCFWKDVDIYKAKYVFWMAFFSRANNRSCQMTK